MIVFGWNHFNIKTFRPKELNLTEEENADFSIERRQKYFHLFFIPFFGIGKTWSIRKKDNKLYEVPGNLGAFLDAQPLHIKSPWYTYAGPILILVAGFFFWLSQTVNDYNNKKRWEAEFIEKHKNIDEKISSLGTNDYIVFRSTKYEDKYAQVLDHDKSRVLLRIPIHKMEEYYPTAMQIHKYFANDSNSFERQWINLVDLKKTICKNYEEQNVFKGVRLFNSINEELKLEEIHRVNGPDIVSRGTGAQGANYVYIDFINNGFNAKLTEVKSLDENVKWACELPMIIESDKSFSLNGTSEIGNVQYKFEMTFLDDNNQQFKFLVEGRGLDRKVKKLEKTDTYVKNL